MHDENAWGLDGVSGHAGLYSSALDLGVFCQVGDPPWSGESKIEVNGRLIR